MEIDLNDTPIGFAETNFENMKLKSNKLVKEIQFYRNSKNLDHDIIIIPMSIFNILDTNPVFQHSYIDSTTPKDILLYVGDIFGLKCYLDMQKKPDTITLSYDVSLMRDNKIDFLLNESELKKEINITVLNY